MTPFNDLLYRALEATGEERAQILDQCGDAALSNRVRQLIDDEHELGGFLDLGTGEHSIGSLLLRRLPGGPSSGDPPPAPTAVGLAEVRRRLERLGRIASVVFTAGAGALVAIAVLLPGFFFAGPWEHVVGTTVVLLLLSLGLSILCRRADIEDTTIVALGHLYLISISGLAAYFHALYELDRFGHVTAFGPYVLAIAVLPLVLSTGPRQTLISGVVASLTVFAGFFAAQQVTSVKIELSTYLELALVAPGAGLLTAVVLSRNMSRLRAEVAEIRRLGSYRLEEKLGEGGMGEVWRAKHYLLARPAAVKLIRPVHLRSLPQKRAVVLERFLREARATAALDSIHTVKLYDFGVADDGTLFIAMELLDGIDLLSLVHRFGPQPAARVRDILLQVCDSLTEAHEQGLIHRDVKPANVMLCRQGRRVDLVKVLDFGVVALTVEPDEALTHTGALLGTPAYVAPEILGGGQADPRSDLYSLGCVAYWLLSGRLVFDHVSQARQIAAHLRDDPAPLASLGVEIGEALQSLVMRCLAKDPAERPRSAQDLATSLRARDHDDSWGPKQAEAWWARHFSRSGAGGATSKHHGAIDGRTATPG